jgi:hypothetical protein
MYSLPTWISEPPTSVDVDFAPYDIYQGGVWAKHAAGCSAPGSTCAIRDPNIEIGGSVWERWGDYYYYYRGTDKWQPSADDYIPEGLYFNPSGYGVHFNSAVTLAENVSIIAAEEINIVGAITVDPVGAAWKPYGGIGGSGILLFSNQNTKPTGANAINVTSDTDAEGIIYAPEGGCQISGAATYTGGMSCWEVDASGSTGQIIFNIAWCPPPSPQIYLAE